MNKYLVVFDLETTGLDKKKDQIIQFAGLKFDRETNAMVDSYSTYVQPHAPYAISLGAYFKHGLDPKFLSDKPFIEDVANDIVTFFADSDVLTYNGLSFDIPFLKQELNKHGYDIDFTARECYDAFLEEKRRHGNTLEETYARYAGRTMEEAGLIAHDAFSDVKATYSVYFAQGKTAPVEAEQMFGEDNAIKLMNFQGSEQPCFAMGKYRGVSVKYVYSIDKNYIEWALSDKCDFMLSTKESIKSLIS